MTGSTLIKVLLTVNIFYIITSSIIISVMSGSALIKWALASER